MKHGSALRKIPGGKTVKVDITISDDGKILEAIISGDFFIYPEDALEDLEKELKNKTISEALKVIGSFKEKMEVLGASLEVFAELLKEAYEKALAH